MSDEENTTPASPAWMQTQAPKVETEKPSKSRRPRRTKAQMAESRAPIAGTVVEIVDNETVTPCIDYETAHSEPISAHDLVRAYGPLAVSVLALITAVTALLRH